MEKELKKELKKGTIVYAPDFKFGKKQNRRQNFIFKKSEKFGTENLCL